MRDLIDELLQAKVKAQLFGTSHTTRLGRLEILEPLGSGGMGTVFLAHDPRLERKVAVKLVKGGSASSELLLREARALGKLNHPNVVAVYDASESDGVVAIVMELAPGESLRSFICREKPWPEIVRVMREAGAGLAAAHRAGVVHRDVKPENIVIGPDRVRLVDFGLASAGGVGDALEGSGTPSYMAPEVLAGEPATALSDQFGFGVTLFEALHGDKPHRTKALAELAEAARTAHLARPKNERVPGWLNRLVSRTLAADPAQRFASMDAVIQELGGGRRRRQRTIALGVGLASLVGLALATSRHHDKPIDPCGDGSARVSAAFSHEKLARLRASLGDAPWARKAADALVEQTGAWERSHRRVCEATRLHQGQPESLLELRMRCLDRRFERMSSLGEALAGSLDGEAKESASEAIAMLPRPERCETLSDASELALPDDAEQRRAVQSAERELDRASAAFALGRYREAQKLAASAPDIPFPPYRAARSLLLGSVEARLGAAEAARTRLRAALEDAAAARASGLELELWLRLLKNELFEGNADRVVEWASFARAAAGRAGTSAAEIDGVEGEARRVRGELTEARQLLVRALAQSAELRGDQRALLEMNLGALELESAHPLLAEAAFRRALRLAEGSLGDGHPGLGLYLDKLAVAARARGRIKEALEHHDGALALRRSVYGDSDRAVGTSLFRRGQTLLEAGQLAKAEADLRRAREIRVAVHGPKHRRLGEIDAALAEVAAARGELARARELRHAAHGLDPSLTEPDGDVERLLSAWRAAGAGVGASLSNRVGRALQRSGRRDEAAQAFEKALGALADEPSRERLAALVGLGECARGARAKESATQALALLGQMPELQRRAKGDGR